MVPSGNSDFTDVDYVKLFTRAASGEEFDFLLRKGVCSDHPCRICVLNFVGEARKVRVWCDLLCNSGVRTISSGDFYWRDNGPRVMISEKKGELAIGYRHTYVLVEVETEMETDWILKEYRAFGKEYERCRSAIFEISFEPKESSPSPKKSSSPKESSPSPNKSSPSPTKSSSPKKSSCCVPGFTCFV